MGISVVLSGADNDADVLRTAACFAARQRCPLRVVLTPTFPRGTLLRQLDRALWHVAELCLETPQIVVERQRAPEAPRRPVRTDAAGA